MKSRLPREARAAGRLLEGAERVLIGGHIRPDGDCVGSCLGLAAIARRMGKKVQVVIPDPVSRRYAFLSGAARVKRPEQVRARKIELFVALDTAIPDRLGGAHALFGRARVSVNIDHHPSNGGFADVDWVDGTSSSVGEMLTGLACGLGWEMPRPAAEALYTAIYSDTGRFGYGNTTGSAMRAAARLLEKGFNPERVAEIVGCQKSPGQWELDIKARSSLATFSGGRIATITLTRRDFESAGTHSTSAEDLASLPRQLRGVRMGLFFCELDGGLTKVGVRTSRGVDADAFARGFGGGGHARASGFMLGLGLAAAKKKVIGKARRFVARSGGGKR